MSQLLRMSRENRPNSFHVLQMRLFFLSDIGVLAISFMSSSPVEIFPLFFSSLFHRVVFSVNLFCVLFKHTHNVSTKNDYLINTKY